jgi:spermidine synthase
MSRLARMIEYFTEKIIYKTNSEYNSTLEVVRSGNKIILDAKSVNYSYGGLHRAFRQLFKKININKLNIRNVLILGFGAGSVASILQHEYGIDCEITGVEIDPEVIRLGKEYFNFNSFRNLELIEEDAFRFMEKNTKTFDLVVVDLFIDKDVPFQAETNEFANLIKFALRPDGRLIFNKWVHDTASSESYIRLEKVLGNTFSNLTICKTGHDRMNSMLVCKKSD